jgi:hypothetical protein
MIMCVMITTTILVATGKMDMVFTQPILFFFDQNI